MNDKVANKNKPKNKDKNNSNSAKSINFPLILQENGCLQVVPGSHTRDFEHLPGSGLHAQGEWATPGDAVEGRNCLMTMFEDIEHIVQSG